MTIFILPHKRQGYLKYFYETVFGNPVKFAKGSSQNRLLRQLLNKPPVNYVQDKTPDNAIIIELPRYSDLNVDYNYYLTQRAKDVLYKDLYSLFYTALYRNIRELENSGSQIKDALYMFMEKTGIPEDHYDCLIKKCYRNRKKKQKLSQVPIFF